MIEFNGYLTGSAEEYFQKRSKTIGLKIGFAAMILLLPATVIVWLRTRISLFPYLYTAGFLGFLLIAIIPRGKKERLGLTPKKIFTEDGYIVCIADRYTDSRLISEVKCVKKFPEFYELVFPFGKISEKFICQKSLLTKGSLEEFEQMFECEIIEM